MLGGAELLAAVSGAALTPLTGVLHRYVRNSFIASALSKGTALDILSGEWARKTGGRLNFPNRYRAAYIALDAVTARVEAERIVAPYVHLPIVANLQHVLRVDDPAISRLLELSPSELRVEWRAANARGIEVHTQRLGNVSYAARRIEAIAYPSTVNPGGVCVGVFPERLSPGSFLEIQDPDGVIQERIAG